MLKYSTEDSLLLIDEFVSESSGILEESILQTIVVFQGKGTNVCDGVSLLASTIRSFLDRGEEGGTPPKVRKYPIVSRRLNLV